MCAETASNGEGSGCGRWEYETIHHANSDDETKQEVLAVGMDAFCPKPFKYRDFELIIESNRDLFLITGN
jgi:predicted Fe-S protein YdhL (DUF1289 family)